MKKLSLCAVALLLTAFSVLGQGVKIQAFTTNSGPVVTNIVVALSSNLLPNRLLSTNTITGVRVFAATNGSAAGFWLDPATITPGQATNVISVAAGTGITIVTNVLLRTISTPAVTNNETRQITFQGAATLKDGSDNSLLAGQRKLVTGASTDLDWFNHILNHTEAANNSWLGSAERMTNAPVSILRTADGTPLTNGIAGQALLSLGNGGVAWGAASDTNGNMPFVTVSAKGLANGLSSFFNDGMDYGPDTPATATSGIQEAINSFSLGTNGRPNGVYLKFGIGNYFFTNRITYSNNWDYQMVWEGVGKFATRWVFAGTNRGINTVEFKGGGNPSPSLNCSATVVIRDGVFSAINPTTNVLLCITNENTVWIQRVNFSSWKQDTAQDWMSSASGLADQADYTITTNGLVGAVLGNMNDGGVKIFDVEAGFLAVGLVLHTDHVLINDYRDPLCGVNAAAQEQTAWPITHPYRSGAGIIRYPGLDAQYNNVHAYSDKVFLALMNYPPIPANAEIQQLRNIILEGSSPALTAIVTNGSVWTVDAPNESQGSGPFDSGNQGRINTNDFSFASIAPIDLRGIVFNSPAFIKNTTAQGGLHIQTGQLIGNARGATNIPGIYPIARTARSTNAFNVINSRGFNLDGIWVYNSTKSAYTNASYSGTAALVDNTAAPPQKFVTFTNAAHPLPDYLATIEDVGVTNSLDSWIDNNTDGILGMYAWWSEATNNEAFIEGRLKNFRLSSGAGGATVLSDESFYLVTTSVGSIILPDIRTNAGRVVFIKSDNGVVGAQISTSFSQTLEGGPITMLPGEGYTIAAINGAWRVVSKVIYSGIGLTNLQAANIKAGGTLPVLNAASLTNYGGIKVYRALLTQTGTGAPVATVMPGIGNTIGAIVWARSSLGTYTATLTGAFTANKTWITIPPLNQVDIATPVTISFKRTSSDVLTLLTGNGADQVDDVLDSHPIEILVYP